MIGYLIMGVALIALLKAVKTLHDRNERKQIEIDSEVDRLHR